MAYRVEDIDRKHFESMTAGLELTYNVNLSEVIGSGGYGDVFHAERKDDRLKVAIKVIRRPKLQSTAAVCSQCNC